MRSVSEICAIRSSPKYAVAFPLSGRPLVSLGTGYEERHRTVEPSGKSIEETAVTNGGRAGSQHRVLVGER